MSLGPWGAVAGGVLGAIAGSQGNKENTTSSQDSSVNLRDINDLNKGRSNLESTADTQSLDSYNSLANMVNAGPGQSAVSDALGAQNQYASFLQNMFQNGGMPNQQQVGQAQGYAQQMFAPQQTALNQQFYDQGIAANRLAARMGRPGTDPILKNKLMQEQTRQQTMLNSQQGAFAANYADQLPQRQAQMGEAYANVRQQLGNQAFQNRQSLMLMGQQLVQNERNYRLQSAGRSVNSNQTTTSGGGVAGAIGGALAGAGGMAGVSGIMSGLSGMFSTSPTSTPVADSGSTSSMTGPRLPSSDI